MIYFASLCVAPPPRACRLSRKKTKDKQRMTLRRTRGDSMLNAMNFESNYDESSFSVNELLKSLLGPFIQLVANDCGYAVGTKELICN